MSRPFFETLRELRNGATLNDLGDSMAELIGHVRATGKPGKLMLEITVKPASKSDASTVLIEDDVKIKKPKIDRAATIFYSTANNELTRQDPKQRDFILEPVGGKPQTPAPPPPAPPGVDPLTGEMAGRA